jgi:hypothetical protein
LLAGAGGAAAGIAGAEFNNATQAAKAAAANQPKKTAILTDFGFDEGLYLDSRTITLHASWVFFCTFTQVALCSGVHRWAPGMTGGFTWAKSVQDIAGWRSWLSNTLDPKADVIVDLGEGQEAAPIRPPIRQVGF